jgi:glutamate synthase domain-containing protein 3
MTGGELYVLDQDARLPLRLNGGQVIAERGAGEELRALLERHRRHTGSTRAAALLERWEESATRFWRVVPRSEEGAVGDDTLQTASA